MAVLATEINKRRDIRYETPFLHKEGSAPVFHYGKDYRCKLTKNSRRRIWLSQKRQYVKGAKTETKRHFSIKGVRAYISLLLKYIKHTQIQDSDAITVALDTEINKKRR